MFAASILELSTIESDKLWHNIGLLHGARLGGVDVEGAQSVKVSLNRLFIITRITVASFVRVDKSSLVLDELTGGAEPYKYRFKVLNYMARCLYRKYILISGLILTENTIPYRRELKSG